ncbi:restriction endonuclease subunit S [Haemophilus parainfluenzae]|jgi:type I restriction enzyme ecoAI specificity protein|uniref:restriction endonuclease subunit S n=1 Tax=Haemophilus parainfluenzae TaxID=729 RepID=UPI0018A54409|nr:restriction endonuclease subunit S [Haemophilus parainfluenzae]QOR08263.1 restriction endonuclease subunit S [Haemophilus parainfluenzae]
MKAQQLKNAILQLAIQGKLVPQDPNDEPASVLFEKIQAEKEKLIAEGKIKKTKKTSNIRPLDMKADFPFEIPKNWVWVRLGDVISVSSGKNLTQKQMKGTGKYPVYGGNGITGYFDEYLVEKNTIVIGRVGYYCGSALKVISNSWVTDNALIVKYSKSLFFPDFLLYLLNQLNLKDSSVSTAQPVISAQRIYPLKFPLPPLNEQKRIVAKIEELLPFIEEYDKKEQKLTTLNQQFPDQLKKSILQAAIQGQLVAQAPNDEPASELIKRIQAEKERLISEKKIKKPKVKSEIVVRDGLPYEIINGVERCIADELPFEIPESWCWVRLGDIFEINSGLTFSKADLISKNIDSVRVLRGGNIKDSNINLLDNDLYLSKAKIKNDEYYLREFDILTPSVTSLENVGKFGLYREEGEKASFGGFVFCLRSLTKVSENNIFYIFYILQSGYVISKMKSLTRKSGQAFYNLGKENFKQILIPIPPLNEQKRIVQKIEEVFSHIQSL